MASIIYCMFFLYIIFHIGYFELYFNSLLFLLTSNTFQIFLKFIEFVCPGISYVLDK